jgi:hypothetical protein
MPNSNEPDLLLDVLKALLFLRIILSVYYNQINLDANANIREQGIKANSLTAYTSGSTYNQKAFFKLMSMCHDDNELLADAGKRITDDIFKELLVDRLHAG